MSGSHARKKESRPRGPRPIGDVVAQLLVRRGYAAQQQYALQAETWSTVAGAQLARLSRPGNLRGGVLEVFVSNSPALQELTFQKRELLKRLSEALPTTKIRDLKFRLGSVAETK